MFDLIREHIILLETPSTSLTSLTSLTPSLRRSVAPSLRFFINRHSLRDFPDNFRDIPILFSICCDLRQFKVGFILSGVTIHARWVRLRPFTYKRHVILFNGQDRIHHFRVVKFGHFQTKYFRPEISRTFILDRPELADLYLE